MSLKRKTFVLSIILIVLAPAVTVFSRGDSDALKEL